jgi:acyl-CoA reductase-like NAD-dependent aldehyde dehydrogenase
VLVEEPVADALLARIDTGLTDVRVGDPREEKTRVSALIDAAAQESSDSHTRIQRLAGARCATPPRVAEKG